MIITTQMKNVPVHFMRNILKYVRVFQLLKMVWFVFKHKLLREYKMSQGMVSFMTSRLVNMIAL